MDRGTQKYILHLSKTREALAMWIMKARADGISARWIIMAVNQAVQSFVRDQGLEADNLLTTISRERENTIARAAFEWGFRCGENGKNIQAALAEFDTVQKTKG